MWQEIEQANSAGWRRVRCMACGFTTAPTPSPLDAIAACPKCRTDDSWITDVARATAALPLGDMTAAALEAIGITKERVNAWRGEIGPCRSCVDRQEWLNKLGRKIATFLGH